MRLAAKLLAGLTARHGLAVVRVSAAMNGDSPDQELTICSCTNCSGRLRFDTSRAGETIQCPHCGMETALLISPSAAFQDSAPPPKFKNVAVLWVLAGIVLVTMIATFGYMQETRTDAGDDFGVALIKGFSLAFSIAAGLGLYVLPALVAHQKRKRNFTAILVLNIVAGWTFIGWVVALVWACTVDTEIKSG